MKQALAGLLTLAFSLAVIGRATAEPAPTDEQLVGAYFKQGTTFSYRLDLSAKGTYRLELEVCLGSDLIEGTWRHHGAWVVLTQTSTHPTAMRKDAFRRLYVLPEGAGWALVPKSAMGGRFGPPGNHALRRVDVNPTSGPAQP